MRNFKTFSFGIAAATAATALLIGGSAGSTLAAQATAAATMSGTAAATSAPVPGSGLVNGPLTGEANTLTGAGSTFDQILFTKWFKVYQGITNVSVNYQAIGSGGGVKGITDGTVDFGASDAYLTDDQLAAAKTAGRTLVNIPVTMGAVALSYTVPDLKDQLKLTGDLVAKMFLGTITKWNDPALVALNPGLANVSQDIIIVHRADGSGTTKIFTDYLSAVSADWKAQLGSGTTVNWPVGLGAKGNTAVAGDIKNDTYAIGYIELGYAIQNGIPSAAVQNKTGAFINPSLESVVAASAAFLPQSHDDLRDIIVNADGAASYPISGYSWMLFKLNYKQAEAAQAQAITRMAWWAIHDGQAYAESLYYAPLPIAVIQKAEKLILQINIEGTQALPTSIATPAPSTGAAATMAATKSS